MKINFLKQLLPVATFSVAITGAFTTNAMEENARSAALVRGFERLNPAATSCQQHDMCSDINTGNVCTIGLVPGATQLWAKNSANECKLPLYRP